MAIEIVDFPIENGGSFHSSVIVNVYQRVYWNIWCFYMLRRVSQLWSNIVTNCGCGLYCNLPYEPQTLHHIILSQSSHMVCLKPRVPQNHPLSPQAKQGLYWLFFYWNPNLKDSPCEQRVTRAIHCDVFTAQNARVARLIQYRGPCIARCSGTAVSKQPPKWGFDVIWSTNRVNTNTHIQYIYDFLYMCIYIYIVYTVYILYNIYT